MQKTGIRGRHWLFTRKVESAILKTRVKHFKNSVWKGFEMEDFEQNQNYEMIKERMKERPINRKKLMRRTLITVSMAVIFGVFACITFLVLEPVISNLLYPEPAPEVVELPEEMDEKYEEYGKIYERFFKGEEDSGIEQLKDSRLYNTSIANYVWLPIRFEGDMAYIDWKDEWRIEDYESL